MDNPNFFYPEYEEQQNISGPEQEWNIQNHGTRRSRFLHPISPSSLVPFSASQGYSASATVSPTDRYLQTGPSYEGFEAQRPPNDSLQSGSEYGLTSGAAIYSPTTGVPGYSVAPVVTQPSQHSYYQQTYDQSAQFSPAWDSRFEPSHRYTVPVYHGYQPPSGVQAITEQAIEQQQPRPEQHRLPLGSTTNTMGDFIGTRGDDSTTTLKASKKGKSKDKRQGRRSLDESEQPRRRALPDSRRTKGPTPDSVSKRTTSSKSGLKGKSTPAAASPSSRNKTPIKEDLDDSEEEVDCGSSSNNNDSATHRSRHNQVEQKYRHRLNAHFDQLLEVLPNSMSEIPGQPRSPPTSNFGHGGRGMGLQPERERKVSKAEVLDRARLYIQSLESDARRLMANQEELKARWEEFSRSNQQGHEGKDAERG